jgi:hypothetical protein
MESILYRTVIIFTVLTGTVKILTVPVQKRFHPPLSSPPSPAPPSPAHRYIVQIRTGGAGRTGGAVCKVSYSLARATRMSWVQVPTAFLARLGNKYLLKSLMMSTLHSAFVLDKPP